MPHSYKDLIRFVKPEGNHRIPFHAFCDFCGVEVKACTFCYTRPETIHGFCTECYNSYSFGPQPAEKPEFICRECDLMRFCENAYGRPNYPVYPRNEIVGYSYKPVCKCCPVSPTNFKSEPYFQPIITNLPPTPQRKRRTDAWVAFKREMDFSGNSAQALILYSSFFRGTKPLDHTNQNEDKLSLRKILQADERPTNRQFLYAIEKLQAKEKAKADSRS